MSYEGDGLIAKVHARCPCCAKTIFIDVATLNGNISVSLFGERTAAMAGLTVETDIARLEKLEARVSDLEDQIEHIQRESR